jgi:hypothetical protein
MYIEHIIDNVKKNFDLKNNRNKNSISYEIDL